MLSAVRTVYYISDGTAITTETVGNAVPVNSRRCGFKHVTVPFVDSVERANCRRDSFFEQR